MAKPVESAAKSAAPAQAELNTETPQNVPAVVTPSKVQGFIDSVFAGDRAKQVLDSLGEAVSFNKFRASVATAIMNNFELIKCEPSLVFREVARVAALGLVFDHHLGEAYLFASWNRKTNQKDMPQCRVGYRGLLKLARNESNVLIYAHEVREHDIFECVLGLEKTLTHKHPPKFAPRGDVIGYYAVAKFRDEHDTDFEPMSKDDVLAIRDRTEGWKAFKAGRTRSGGPWETDEVEMGKKTVLRRLWKRLPSGPKVAAAIKIEDDAEGIILPNEPSPPQTPAPKRPAADALDRFAAKPRGNGTVTDVATESEFPSSDDGDPGNQGDQTGSEPAAEQSKPAEASQAQAEPEKKVAPAVYVEPDEPAAETMAEPTKAAAPAGPVLPEMPEDAKKEWLTEGKWMAGYKWFSVTVSNSEDADFRRAMAMEHMIMMRAVAAKSAGYKDAVTRFFGAYCSPITLDTPIEGDK